MQELDVVIGDYFIISTHSRPIIRDSALRRTGFCFLNVALRGFIESPEY